ncbi:hypothetical protein [Streptomyces sporangiiformans]|uniref:Uncharacterized protein n=1 Tax=Streptomyces sporangiiformans TaxID=2315329 RepID=A0A505DI65_9ACTN|nr:hypothetical protein [Streptomyces sporangiiformans]TPQ21555.1 hypothetical protein FGD71_014385 [Streptomyces sporangiiformans]
MTAAAFDDRGWSNTRVWVERSLRPGDGSATCVFVMPSTVDGRAAHTADPLANDQDRHLVLWLRAQERAEQSRAIRA